ncbi:histidinol-phosphatase [Actinospica acidiphila]|uniref:Histidinol-phosphatase n=2 Tax=Streptomyces TaxID=1883 RepID=A0ABP7YMQ3_9ACTN|nr:MULTISPECIES: histidinol-phosphatase [Streptomyces]MBJ6614836.1 histidinol-phosphatase [Streptomyces sp. I3(2020)]NEA83679.1 histidinol-phosphatase [Actinospica acidiphila]MBJ6625187.1 histidinol-phosphatase [Streptomyces sp. I4(2020)]MBQ0972194.1 histidinol-phosphatase [Streptomyces sp. RK31]MBU5947900.1 histidinol-phosphatase [Streptomyces sp. PAM3C]
MPDYLDDLRLAHVLADAADAATMDRFKALDLKVETKPDMTPVSEADKGAEELIRGHLQRARPRDAVLGEEYGVEGTGPRRWVIDPIDGTKNYVRGVPVWATLIALMEAGGGGASRSSGVESGGGFQPVVGVVSAPALGRRWWAAKGHGAYAGRSLSSATRLQVSRVSRISDASFAYSSLTGWEEQGRLDGFLDLTREVWRTRAYGDFWPYMMVAEGSVDICAEPELSLWDMAATAIVVTESGGTFTGLDGRPGPHSGNAAASNGLLHDELLGYLNQRY